MRRGLTKALPNGWFKLMLWGYSLKKGSDCRHRCQLNVSLAVLTAAIQTKPAYAGYQTLDSPLVRAGGLGFYSSEFHSPELKLTPMDFR
jgi:hypothetical protein